MQLGNTPSCSRIIFKILCGEVSHTTCGAHCQSALKRGAPVVARVREWPELLSCSCMTRHSSRNLIVTDLALATSCRDRVKCKPNTLGLATTALSNIGNVYCKRYLAHLTYTLLASDSLLIDSPGPPLSRMFICSVRATCINYLRRPSVMLTLGG